MSFLNCEYCFLRYLEIHIFFFCGHLFQGLVAPNMIDMRAHSMSMGTNMNVPIAMNMGGPPHPHQPGPPHA